MQPASPLQVEISHAAIHAANGANTFVAGQYLLSQITGICAQPPFMDAPIRTEGEAAHRNFKIAPAAQTTAVRAFLKGGSIGKPAGHGARSAQETFLAQIVLS